MEAGAGAGAGARAEVEAIDKVPRLEAKGGGYKI
jgi:hypothetical protein